MPRTDTRLTRRPLDRPARDIVAGLSKKLSQIRAYDRFEPDVDAPDEHFTVEARSQDAGHVDLLLSALREHLRRTPAEPVGRTMSRQEASDDA